jgi:hypothetical protein
VDEVEPEPEEGLETYCKLEIDDLTLLEPPDVVGVIKEDGDLVDRLPLFRTGPPENEDNADEDRERPDVLVGVVKLNLDEEVALVDVVLLRMLEVDVGRNTPLLAV